MCVIGRIAEGSADLMTTKDVCKMLDISRTTLTHWIDENGTAPQPDIYIAGKARWERSTIKRWIASMVAA